MNYVLDNGSDNPTLRVFLDRGESGTVWLKVKDEKSGVVNYIAGLTKEGRLKIQPGVSKALGLIVDDSRGQRIAIE